MRKAPGGAAVSLLAFALLTACGGAAGGAITASPKPSSSTTAVVGTIAATPSATPSLTPTTRAIYAVRCEDKGGEEHWFDDYRDAWSLKSAYCDGDAEGVALAVEERALKAAYGTSEDLQSLGVLYSLCATASRRGFSYLEGGGSEPQEREIKGMLTLCPAHPLTSWLKEMLVKSAADRKLRSEGRIFGSGVFRVGKEIQPGTYVASNGEGCYWERQDRNGVLIDNDFHRNAARVQVTIYPSDYAFSSDDCGEWRPA